MRVLKICKKTGAVLAEYESISEAAKANNIPYHYTYMQLRGDGLTSDDHFFRQDGAYKGYESYEFKVNRPVIAFNVKDHSLLWFPTRKAAGKHFFVCPEAVTNAISKKTKIDGEWIVFYQNNTDHYKNIERKLDDYSLRPE